METATNIRKMLTHQIEVPNYQRAYSWDVEAQVKTFLKDLEEHINSQSKEKYYFGHFLFENSKNNGEIYSVIDGQQRVTTIVICLSALFSKLKSMRELNNDEEVILEDTIKRKDNIKFSTVDYDNQNLIDYIINCATEGNYKTANENTKFDTNSSNRLVKGFNYFKYQFYKKDEAYIKKILDCIINSTCTTHQVENSVRAVQMFIFQNDRGKKPTNLEILKSKFMYHIHLKSENNPDEKIKEISNKFGSIYKNISKISVKLKEDDILQYAYRYHKNALYEYFSMEEVDKILEKNDCLNFINKFTFVLEETFEKIKDFCEDGEKMLEAHSLITLGGIGIAYPFIVKAYKYNCSDKDKALLFRALEHIILRKKLIGDRAVLESRFNGVYKNFVDSTSVAKIINHINWLKTTKDGWWNYWNNGKLEESIQYGINHNVAKFVLWKYENYLLAQLNTKSGYNNLKRYDEIEKTELEHIYPQTEPQNGYENSGYCAYDDDFKSEGYLDCFGNYLLISKSHNCSIGNKPFADKAETYIVLEQQKEVKAVYDKQKVWNKKSIDERDKKIINFILENI